MRLIFFAALPSILCLAASVSYTDEFWPDESFSEGDQSQSDLLVVIWPKQSLGRSPLQKCMQQLKDGTAGFERERELKMVSCRGCGNYDNLIGLWKLNQKDLPVAIFFPKQQEFGDLGRFRLDLVGLEDPLAGVKSFVGQFDTGKLQPWVASQPPPVEEDQGLVREVVGTTYRQEVTELNQSVILLLYSSWCGWSKKVQPIFRQLAQHVGKNPILRFAQLNSHNNDIPPPYHFRLGSVPRFHLLKREQKDKPQEFSEMGNMKYEDMLQWLRKEVTGLAEFLDKPHSDSQQPESGFGDLDSVNDL